MLIGETGALIGLLFASATVQGGDDPLTRPIVGARTAEWLAPRVPTRVFGNTYLVGFGGLSVALIDTGKGLILIDGALPQSTRGLLANVSRLGFRPSEIKYILSTEPHYDHAGGLAALARDTGAIVIASPRGAEGLRSGRLAADDPQRHFDHSFPPVSRVGAIRDRQVLRLGNTIVTAYATPGHTMGSMSWSWRSCEVRRCRTIVFASSLNPVAPNEYRYTAPGSRRIVQGFARSYATMKSIRCDVLITAHPDPADGSRRYSERPGACRDYARNSERALALRIADERKDMQPLEPLRLSPSAAAPDAVRLEFLQRRAVVPFVPWAVGPCLASSYFLPRYGTLYYLSCNPGALGLGLGPGAAEIHAARSIA